MLFQSQSPSLRGSGRFGIGIRWGRGEGEVSIPFIAGQWSLPPPSTLTREEGARSQSPSLRGSGRFAIAMHSK